MRIQLLIALMSISACIFASVNAQGRSQNPARIPMEQIKALYFKDGHKTLSRRGKPLPQLQCIGNSEHICNTYGPDIVLCKNQGDGAWKVSIAYLPNPKKKDADFLLPLPLSVRQIFTIASDLEQWTSLVKDGTAHMMIML